MAQPSPSPPETTQDPARDEQSYKKSSGTVIATAEVDNSASIATAPALPSVGPTIPASPVQADTIPDGLSPVPTTNTPDRRAARRALLDRVGSFTRQFMLVVALLAAIAIFLQQVNQHYPIKHWLFWSYAKIWGYCSLFILAVAGSGHVVGNVIGLKTMPFVERTVFSMAAGVLAFFFLMFGAGLLGIYGYVFSIVMPAIVILATSVPLFRHVRRVVRVFRAAHKRTTWRPPVWFLPVLLFGVCGLAMVYFAILSPRNVAYDAHFYHLAIAQQYATESQIRPFLDGWLPGAVPHFASVLYTWAFILPGFNMFERITCAAHIEFILFLATMVAVPVLVRKLVPNASAGLSFAAFFLFPGIFVYDSTLSAAADHIAAFWAIPIYLAMLRCLRSLNVWQSRGAHTARNFGLLGAVAAGAVLTKYQSIYLLAFPAMAIGCAMFWYIGRAIIRRDQRRAIFRAILVGSGTALVAGLLLSTPHWLKNYVWYGDPLFPQLYKYFHSPQWTTNVGDTFELWHEQTKSWSPQGPLSTRLQETARAMVAFSFEPHDWQRFHGKIPVFGSLFTLSVLVLPFLKKTRRIWALFIATEMGIGIWFWTLHQDRYLQILVPWMVCVVVAVITLLWRAHWTARILASGLVGLQIVWGGDAYFIQAHAMTSNSAAPITIELLSLGMKGKYAERYAFGDRLGEIGRDPVLPRNAKVLLHEWQTRLGLWRPVVSDFPGHMYAFRYEELSSPTEVDRRMRGLGITHIVTRTRTSSSFDSLGADIQFFAFVNRDTSFLKEIGGWAIHALHPTPTTRTSNNLVAYLGCGPRYERGLYTLAQLSIRDRLMGKKPPRVSAPTPAPQSGPELRSFVLQADYVVTDPKCKSAIPVGTTQGYVPIGTRDSEQLWLRPR